MTQAYFALLGFGFLGSHTTLNAQSLGLRRTKTDFAEIRVGLEALVCDSVRPAIAYLLLRGPYFRPPVAGDSSRAIMYGSLILNHLAQNKAAVLSEPPRLNAVHSIG